jgi:hypothetical protein
MLTMLYEGEPGWSGPLQIRADDQGRVIEAKCLSCRTIWKHGPRMARDEERLPGSKGQQR